MMEIFVAMFFCVVCLNIGECPSGIHTLCKQLAPWGQECEVGTESLSGVVLTPSAEKTADPFLEEIHRTNTLGDETK